MQPRDHRSGGRSSISLIIHRIVLGWDTSNGLKVAVVAELASVPVVVLLTLLVVLVVVLVVATMAVEERVAEEERETEE